MTENIGARASIDIVIPTRVKRVVVRTHGGLGNQLFQIFYGRLFAGDGDLAVIHDANYPHKFGLSAGFAGLPEPGLFARTISAARIPKLLERCGLSTSGNFRLGGTAYLDGYFQSADLYEGFGPIHIRRTIDALRARFAIDTANIQGDELHHIRLGDFFSSERAEREHLNGRLAKLPDGAFIMTNREDLVAQAISADPFRKFALSIVPSAGASPEHILRLMSRYRAIVSNDSTLAFWAACLAERRLVTPSARLNALFSRLMVAHP